jgi:hypothetical protein
MKFSIKDLHTLKPKVSLEQLHKYYLTPYQKNKLDCHRLIKSRFCPFYKDNIARSLEFPYQGFENSFDLEVLPKEEAEVYTKYFIPEFPSDQLWGRPTLIQHIGNVGFYEATVYSDKKTRLSLEAAEQNPKPEIFYKYKIGDREVEADSQWHVARVAYEQRLAKRELKELHRLEVVVQVGEFDQSEGLTSEDISVTSAVPDPLKRDILRISHHDLFGDSDDEEEPEDVESSEDSQYCQVIAVKRYKTDPNE